MIFIDIYGISIASIKLSAQFKSIVRLIWHRFRDWNERKKNKKNGKTFASYCTNTKKEAEKKRFTLKSIQNSNERFVFK